MAVVTLTGRTRHRAMSINYSFQMPLIVLVLQVEELVKHGLSGDEAPAGAEHLSWRDAKVEDLATPVVLLK